MLRFCLEIDSYCLKVDGRSFSENVIVLRMLQLFKFKVIVSYCAEQFGLGVFNIIRSYFVYQFFEVIDEEIEVQNDLVIQQGEELDLQLDYFFLFLGICKIFQ